MEKKVRVHGLLKLFDVKDANGNVYAAGSVKLPEGCAIIEHPGGSILSARLSESNRGIEAEFCVRGHDDAVTTLQTLINARTPLPKVDAFYGSGMAVGGLITGETKVIQNKFWDWVFRWKPMRYMLWFIFRRVNRIRVITGFQLTEISLIQR